MTIRSSLVRTACNHLVLASLMVSPALAIAPPTATLVADLAIGAERNPAQIFDPFALGDRVILPVEEPALGREAWVTDGTDAGTELLLDACPGECSGFGNLVGVANGLAFWVGEAEPTASFPDQRWMLVVSDGTRHGTRRLGGPEGDLTAGAGLFANAAMHGGAVFFQGCTPATGCELWRSDGTEAGTMLVADLVTGAGGAAPHRMVVAGGKLFFFSAAADGLVLYTSDGTAGGTVAVEGIGPQPIANPPVVAGNRIFFVREPPPTGTAWDIWTSDGTAAGTRSLTDFVPQLTYLASGPMWFEVAGDHVYFPGLYGANSSGLWRSDGTASGTLAIVRPAVGSDPDFIVLDPNSIEELGGRLLFMTVRTEDFLYRWRIWAREGGSAKVVVEDCDYCGRRLDHVANRVLFQRLDPHEGHIDLLATDGTAAGTRTLGRVCHQLCGGESYSDILEGGFFVVRNAQQKTALWRTDGTVEGTREFASLPDGVVVNDYSTVFAGGRFYAHRVRRGEWEPLEVELLRTGGGEWEQIAKLPGQPPSSSPHQLIAMTDRLMFAATTTGPRPQLWTTQGTATSTQQLSDLPPPPNGPDDPGPLDVTRLGDRVVFAVKKGWETSRLWTSDGTPAGTFALVAGDDVGSGFATHGGELYFVRSGPGFDEVWKTDGTDAGTAHGFPLPGGNYSRRHLTALGDELYFVIDRGGREVWRSSTSGAGMTLVAAFDSGNELESAPFFTRLGDHVFFTAADRDTGREVWTTSGTPETPAVLVDAIPGETGSRPAELLVFGGALYFFADTPGNRRALFRSDGTAGGTAALRHFRRDTADDPRAGLLAVGGRLYFAADDGVHGRELWTSDGTAAGTRLVADVFPGLASSSPAWLTTVGGRLYFAAHDGVHGAELWTSDGTGEGTALVHDIAPGALSSRPEELELVGSRLFFAAADGLTGRELWMLDLAQATGICVPSSTSLCLGGRFRVEAAWKDFAGNAGVGRTVPLTADTGAFWFFGPENVEVVLKVLDGRPVNEHHWVFYGALSSVEYALTVTDVQTGLTARYRNPAGRLASVADTSGFGRLGAFSAAEHGGSTPGVSPRIWSSVESVGAATGVCTPTAARLCLRGGRFAVEATWRDFAGNSGTGTAVALTGDTGWFWFFGPSNVEVILKVLDGTPVNSKHWVFYGALSSVEYTLRVTDTTTGVVKTYINPSGNLASVADTSAF